MNSLTWTALVPLLPSLAMVLVLEAYAPIYSIVKCLVEWAGLLGKGKL
ncbi:MAG: hypothetical protein VX212_11115 [Pseudomonadota bacterium]|nr:hypothetical protein [Pseudomonadota bacterium]